MNFKEKPKNLKLKEPRIWVDFNELIEDDLVLLSQTDFTNDSKGNIIELKEGMKVKIYEYNDYGDEEEFLFAEGLVELNTSDFFKVCKWNCRIDENGISNKTEIKT